MRQILQISWSSFLLAQTLIRANALFLEENVNSKAFEDSEAFEASEAFWDKISTRKVGKSNSKSHLILGLSNQGHTHNYRQVLFERFTCYYIVSSIN